MGPSPTKKNPDAPLYAQLRARKTLKKAWVKIRANGASIHASTISRRLIGKYSESEDRGLEKLQESLRKETFQFSPARGIAIPKPGKKTKRPLVVFDIDARIIQRAILNLVQELPPIQQTLRSGHNFGGIEGSEFGVPAAICAAVQASTDYAYFIRSDIRSFFDSVARDAAVSALTSHLTDEKFISLVVSATNVELENRKSLGDDIKYFPSSDHGLAQGSCLSPILCNLVLESFDERMNSFGTKCIRYVDDFILFAPDRKRARAALKIGLSELKKLGLSAYNPQENPDKAEEGLTSASINFLGCRLKNGIIQPSLENRRKLLGKIDTLLSNDDKGIVETLGDVSRTIMGWGNTFGFCNDELAMSNLDHELHLRTKRWLYRHLGSAKNLGSIDWLEQVGIQPLAHRKRPT